MLKPYLRHSTVYMIAGILTGAMSLSAAANDALKHVDHVMTHWADTPQEQGLLPVATAEAEVAKTHAGFATSDLKDLSSMQLHTRHVLHALDPAQETKGPGLGYGLIKASEGVATHAELASDSEDASDIVRVSGVMVASVGRNTTRRAEEALKLSKLILASKTSEVAAPHVLKLQELTKAFFIGQDLDKDGRIVWYHHEGGLNIATEQMDLIIKSTK
ncbi:hypothetical protein WH96_01755 [Kiloniella spongiae]|uniref:FTP domain-containing protein n=2 Tax=Kiloniella spongiae TaxID=1489064 RepID=A0A0H2MNA8_9PROT|nr:hypothetical protein WH96_01755 [Kiloniella spongiae]